MDMATLVPEATVATVHQGAHQLAQESQLALDMALAWARLRTDARVRPEEVDPTVLWSTAPVANHGFHFLPQTIQLTHK